MLNQPELRRLSEAAHLLVGAGPVKQRLCDAYVRHLKGMDPDRMPEELAVAFRSLDAALNTAAAVGGLGAVEATIRKMSEQEAAFHAGRVVDIYVALHASRAEEATASRPRQLRLVGDD